MSVSAPTTVSVSVQFPSRAGFLAPRRRNLEFESQPFHYLPTAQQRNSSFPKPFRLVGRVFAWRVDEIKVWAEARERVEQIGP